MTLDIRGSLKNTKPSSNKYVVVDELISNAIDSFLIRKSQEKPSKISNLQISIQIEIFSTSLLPDQFDISISCTDNGCGLGEDQTNAFLTKDTSYKDDLQINGIGQCKGAGRIQFFHQFNNIRIVSTYRSSDGITKRTLEPLEGRKKIEPTDFVRTNGVEAEIGTTITVFILKKTARDLFSESGSLLQTFAAVNIRRHVLISFIQRLVTLKSELGDFDISFETKLPDSSVESANLNRNHLPAISNIQDVNVEDRNPRSGDGLGTFQKFRISHYKLDAEIYDLPKNAVSLCAKSSPVKDITSRYLRTRSEQNQAVEGYHHIAMIEGDLLDRCVNEQRDGFDGIPEELPSSDLFVRETISYSALYEVIDPIIQEYINPAGWSKEEIINEVTAKFGVSAQMLSETDTRVVYGDSAKSIVKRVLKKYQKIIINDTAQIFDLKEEISKAEPDSVDFRTKVDEIAWKYASSLKTFDMANLSQLVVRRTAIVEILALACRRRLEVQAAPDRRKDEKIIHSIFFPMRKDSLEVSNHDIWLLSEEYQYYDYIASDKMLSQLELHEGSKLFEQDIDQEFEKVLKRRADENRAKRPDIAIFSKEGSAIIIEFKSPGISLDDHIGDLSEYAHLLAAKSKGRLKKFYGYLIGDTVNWMRMAGWTRFPEGKGAFQTTGLNDPENGRPNGELYSEILFYEDVVDRARKRIGVYKDRLNIDIER